MSINYLVFSCFWLSLLYLLIVIAITLRSISKDTRCLTQQFIKFLMKWENEKPKCFICRKNMMGVAWDAVLYKGKYHDVCRSCYGHYWNETHNNKQSSDEAVRMLHAIYREHE